MISRRILRIKVLQILYAHIKSGNESYANTEKQLLLSINKLYELYHYLLLLIIDISELAEEKIEIAKQKRIPTEEDLNPNTRFIDNRIIHFFKENIQFNDFITKNKLSWIDYPELVRGQYRKLIKSKLYFDYMADKENDFVHDKRFIIGMIEYLFADNELLHQILEEKSIFWNDDLEFVLSMMVKTISKLKTEHNAETALMPLYRNIDDKKFVKDLLRKSIIDYEDNKELIHKFTKNWEIDRIAFMDILIMNQAITEVIYFPSIPVKVSLNEYIEIAKYYSTEKSSIFINGILDKAFVYLKKEKRFSKQGRGLVE